MLDQQHAQEGDQQDRAVPGRGANIARKRATSTRLRPTWTSVPARAAIGIRFAAGASANTITNTRTPDSTAEMRVTAPAS